MERWARYEIRDCIMTKGEFSEVSFVLFLFSVDKANITNSDAATSIAMTATRLIVGSGNKLNSNNSYQSPLNVVFNPSIAPKT